VLQKERISNAFFLSVSFSSQESSGGEVQINWWRSREVQKQALDNICIDVPAKLLSLVSKRLPHCYSSNNGSNKI